MKYSQISIIRGFLRLKLSTPNLHEIQSDLYHSRFLRLKLSTPNLHEIQSDLYHSRFLRLKLSTPDLQLHEIQSDLYHSRFLRLKLSTPNLHEIQSDLYHSRFLKPKFSAADCNTLLIITTAARNAVALSYHKVRGLYFLAVVFAAPNNSFPCGLCKVSAVHISITIPHSIIFCFTSVFRRLDFNYDLDSQNKTTYLVFQILNVNRI